MDRHLVAVEVGVKRRADQRMQPDRLPFNQDRIEGLNAEAVQRGRAIQKDRVFFNHFVQDIPDFRLFVFDQAFSTLDSRRRPTLF